MQDVWIQWFTCTGVSTLAIVTKDRAQLERLLMQSKLFLINYDVARAYKVLILEIDKANKLYIMVSV